MKYYFLLGSEAVHDWTRDSNENADEFIERNEHLEGSVIEYDEMKDDVVELVFSILGYSDAEVISEDDYNKLNNYYFTNH